MREHSHKISIDNVVYLTTSMRLQLGQKEAV